MTNKFEDLKLPAYQYLKAKRDLSETMEELGAYFVDKGLSLDDAALAINSILYSMLRVNFAYRILAEPESFEEHFINTFCRDVKSLRTWSGIQDVNSLHTVSEAPNEEVNYRFRNEYYASDEFVARLNDQGDVKNVR